MSDGREDKTSDSGGDQRQGEEINVFVPSKTVMHWQLELTYVEDVLCCSPAPTGRW